MVLCEWFVFRKHINPIRRVFKNGDLSIEVIENAFRQAHRFPLLTVCRIFGPHLFALSIPAVLLAAVFIQTELLSLPLYYTLHAAVGAVLIAGMHGIIEFFLSSKAVRPLLITLRNKALMLHGADLTSEAKIHMSIQQICGWCPGLSGVRKAAAFTKISCRNILSNPSYSKGNGRFF
jgi:hypothetical protein